MDRELSGALRSRANALSKRAIVAALGLCMGVGAPVSAIAAPIGSDAASQVAEAVEETEPTLSEFHGRAGDGVPVSAHFVAHGDGDLKISNEGIKDGMVKSNSVIVKIDGEEIDGDIEVKRGKFSFTVKDVRDGASVEVTWQVVLDSEADPGTVVSDALTATSADGRMERKEVGVGVVRATESFADMTRTENPDGTATVTARLSSADEVADARLVIAGADEVENLKVKLDGKLVRSKLKDGAVSLGRVRATRTIEVSYTVPVGADIDDRITIVGSERTNEVNASIDAPGADALDAVVASEGRVLRGTDVMAQRTIEGAAMSDDADLSMVIADDDEDFDEEDVIASVAGITVDPVVVMEETSEEDAADGSASDDEAGADAATSGVAQDAESEDDLTYLKPTGEIKLGAVHAGDDIVVRARVTRDRLAFDAVEDEEEEDDSIFGSSDGSDSGGTVDEGETAGDGTSIGNDETGSQEGSQEVSNGIIVEAPEQDEGQGQPPVTDDPATTVPTIENAVDATEGNPEDESVQESTGTEETPAAEDPNVGISLMSANDDRTAVLNPTNIASQSQQQNAGNNNANPSGGSNQQNGTTSQDDGTGSTQAQDKVELKITSVAPQTTPGSTMGFTVTAHATADLTNAKLNVSVPGGITVDGTSVTGELSGGGTVMAYINDAGDVEVEPTAIANGETLTVRFNGTIDDTSRVGSRLTCTATMTGDGLSRLDASLPISIIEGEPMNATDSSSSSGSTSTSSGGNNSASPSGGSSTSTSGNNASSPSSSSSTNSGSALKYTGDTPLYRIASLIGAACAACAACIARYIKLGREAIGL